jgi:hypothetical protein
MEEPWDYDGTEECEAHAGIECEGDGCPCRKDCCINEDELTDTEFDPHFGE